MTSDKAIQKSVDNGFEIEEHFKASQDIQKLYENAKLTLTRNDKKYNDKAIKIYEFTAEIDKSKEAKILVKESLDKDLRKIYTLELQELKPATPTNPCTDGSITSIESKSLQESGVPLTPLESTQSILPKDSKNISEDVNTLKYGKLDSARISIELSTAKGKHKMAEVEARISHKITSNKPQVELDSMPIASKNEYETFLNQANNADFKNMPEILKIATLKKELVEILGVAHNANVFISRQRGGHIMPIRKDKYAQALTMKELQEIPKIINNADTIYKEKDNIKNKFSIVFNDSNNKEKINMLHFIYDGQGNFILTAQKVDKKKINNYKAFSLEGS